MKIIKRILNFLFYPLTRKTKNFAVLFICLALISCKKKETTKPGNTYTITVEDKTLPSGDSLFFSFDYWFYYPQTPGNSINKQSFNSKYTADGYASDSLHLTSREYRLNFSQVNDYTFTDPPRFVYRIAHYYKLKDQKIWVLSDKGNKSISIKKDGEVIFTNNGAGERSGNMELQ